MCDYIYLSQNLFMIMLGLRTCIYRVSDIEKATEWYAKAFDTQPYFREPYYVGFNIGGYELGLQPEEKSTKGTNVESYWGVKQIQEVYNLLLELGATSRAEPTKVGGELLVASVLDPWDNLIGLIYNPYFNPPDQKFNIYHDVHIKASKEEIYKAVTLPKHLNNWWTKESSGIDKIGSQYRFYFSDAYDWSAIVTKEISSQHFELTMDKSDEDWEGTKFGFIIKEEHQGCLLSFYHKNWTNNNHHYRRTNHCWAILLQGLKDYIEKGKIIPFENRS